MSVIINGTGGGGGTPANPSGSVQYNNAGSFGGFGIYTPATHTLELDAADSATPNPQIVQFQSVLAGTANTSGQLATVNGSFATGIGEPGSVTINTGFVGYDVGRTLTSISNGSPAIFTSPTPHNLFGNQCILLQTTGTLPSPLATLTQYFVDPASLAANTFEVATTLGGAVVNTTSNGSGTHSYVPGGVASLFQSFLPSGPATFFLTAFAGGVVDGMMVQFQSTGSLPVGLSPNTNYFVIAPSTGVPGSEFFAVSATQAGFPPVVCTGGTGTLTYQIQGDIQNQPILGVGFTVGPANLVGNDGTPAFSVRQTWNTSLSSSEFAPLGAPSSSLFSLTANNLRNNTQKTSFSKYQAANTNLNFLNHSVAPNATGGSWYVAANFQDAAPGVEFHNSNFPDTILGLIGLPVEFADHMSFSTTFGHPAPIGVQLGYDNTNGIAAFIHPTSTSPTAVRAYNTTDNNAGAPTNYERGAFDWVTTANVLTIGTQANGTGTVRDFAIVKGANTLFNSKPVLVGGLPAPSAGLQGARWFVTDATQTLTAGIGTVVAGTGGNPVPVVCDGTNWRIG